MTTGGVAAGAGALSCAFSASGLTFGDCWFGDATAVGLWIQFVGSGLVVLGNYIGSGALGVSLSSGSTTGVVIIGNLFDQCTNAIGISGSGNANWVVAGNQFSTTGIALSVATLPTRSLIQDDASSTLQHFGLVHSCPARSLMGRLRRPRRTGRWPTTRPTTSSMSGWAAVEGVAGVHLRRRGRGRP